MSTTQERLPVLCCKAELLLLLAAKTIADDVTVCGQAMPRSHGVLAGADVNATDLTAVGATADQMRPAESRSS